MIKEENRIIYLEPNDFSVNGYDNIPFPTEDYSISVDLQVEKGSRTNCGQVSQNNKIYSLSWRNNGENLSFLSGTKLNGDTDNMLTTSYLDTSFDDVKAGKNNLEGLGIESIDISFDSWFFPRVAIKFIDVRGVSLMMPEDYAHTKAGEKHPGSFFRSFFSFPYPKFNLQVKGFYGGKASFLLAIDDFRTAFNAETGNFEISVTFIGYMYGLLTDISMKHLLAAPFDQYEGSQYWANRKFTFDEQSGIEIPKIMDFLLNISKTNEKFEKLASENDTMRNFKLLQSDLETLNKIRNIYESFYTTLGRPDDIKLKGNFQLLILTTEQQIYQNSNLKRQLITAIDEYNTNSEYDKLSHPNDERTYDADGKEIFSAYDASKLFEIIGGKTVKRLNASEEGILTLTDGYNKLLESRGWKKLIENDEKLLNEINTCVENNSIGNKCWGYLYKDNGFRKTITDRINKKNIELQSLMSKIDEFQKEAAKDIFGWQPSIGNVMKMIFAHLETFLNSIYTCTSNIKAQEPQGERSFGSLMIDKGQSDIKGNVESSTFVPPFPEYTKKDRGKREWAWVGDRPAGGNSMEEVNLVNGFLNGLSTTRKRYEDVINSILNANKEGVLDFFPTNPTDIIGNNNPYTDIFKKNPFTNKISELMSHFALRCMNYDDIIVPTDISSQSSTVGSGRYMTMRPNMPDGVSNEVSRGKLEAYNFFKTHPEIDNELIATLQDNTMDEHFISYLDGTNPNNPYYLGEGNTRGGYHKNNGGGEANMIKDTTYCWLKYKDEYVIPVDFKNINEIKVPETPYISYVDIESNETYKNPYIFSIYDDPSKFLKLKKLIEESSEIENENKKNTLDSWDLDLKNYHNFYSAIGGSTNSKEEPTIIEKFGDERMRTNSNILPLHFRTGEERTSSVSKLFRNTIKDCQGTFFNKLSGDGQNDPPMVKTDMENCRTIVGEYIKGEHEINNLFYPNIQCGINGSLYGHPFFYMQNNIKDDKVRTNVKALLFLHSLPIFSSAQKGFDVLFRRIIGNKTLCRVPKPLLLFLGGLLWRERYYKKEGKDCFIYEENLYAHKYLKPSESEGDEDYKYLLKCKGKTAPLCPIVKNGKFEKGTFLKISELTIDNGNHNIFSFRQSIKNTLIDLFLDWASTDTNQGFKNINNELELRFNPPATSTDEYQRQMDLNAYAIYNIFKIWKDDFDPNHKTSNLNLYRKDEKTKSKTKRIIFDNLTIELPQYLEDFFATFISNNLSKNYMKLGGFETSLEGGLKLMLRESAVVSNSVTRFLLDDMTVFCGVGGNAMFTDSQTKDYSINQQRIKLSFSNFRKELLRLYGYDEKHNEKGERGSPNRETIKTDYTKDVQIATYINFKNLYDKWLASNSFLSWKVDEKDSIFSQFHFVDSFYNSVGQDLMINLEKFSNSIVNIQNGGETESQISLYQFIYSLCADNNLQLYALPIYNDWSDRNTIEKMFTPTSYYDSATERKIGSQFVAMYYHEPSKHLNLDDGYEDDGFDLADSNGNILPTALEKFKSEEGYPIPAFGVTFGRQKQSIFKSVTVNMDNPQVTAPSLMATNAIAEMGSPNRQPVYTGQDLYTVYSNHSYTCNIEMMGCAQITPLMYFQLNNIPMFKGLYMVQNVKHSIVPGNMTTNIMGVRLNKTAIPMVNDLFNIGGIVSQMGDSSSESNTGSDYPYIPLTQDFHPLYIGDDPIPSEDYASFDAVSKLLDKNNEKLIIFEKDQTAWDLLETHMKYLLVSIARTVDRNCDYKVVVTSMGRKYNNSSDHNSGTGTPTLQRTKLGLLKGCAIDICGCSRDYKANQQGYRKRMYSAQLFHLIATTYTDWIRQLIWEDSGGGSTQYRDDNVHNVIHLSSYGQGAIANKSTQIFQSYDENGKSIAITNKSTFEPLSRSFLSTVASLVSNPEYKVRMENILNFANAGCTSEVYKNSLIENYKLKL